VETFLSDITIWMIFLALSKPPDILSWVSNPSISPPSHFSYASFILYWIFQFSFHSATFPYLKQLTLILLMWRIVWAPNSIPIYSYIQQNAALHSLFISANCSTCFGWYFHPSSGGHTTLSTASSICHIVTVIWRCRGRDGTSLSVLWVAHTTDTRTRQ
jgi:hypothetical protein